MEGKQRLCSEAEAGTAASEGWHHRKARRFPPPSFVEPPPWLQCFQERGSVVSKRCPLDVALLTCAWPPARVWLQDEAQSPGSSSLPGQGVTCVKPRHCWQQRGSGRENEEVWWPLLWLHSLPLGIPDDEKRVSGRAQGDSPGSPFFHNFPSHARCPAHPGHCLSPNTSTRPPVCLALYSPSNILLSSHTLTMCYLYHEGFQCPHPGRELCAPGASSLTHNWGLLHSRQFSRHLLF